MKALNNVQEGTLQFWKLYSKGDVFNQGKDIYATDSGIYTPEKHSTHG